MLLVACRKPPIERIGYNARSSSKCGHSTASRTGTITENLLVEFTKMGIRFHCPNGHRLNVKTFLAGKMGICPECGARVRIPEAQDVLSPSHAGSSLTSENQAASGQLRDVHEKVEPREFPSNSGASVAEMPDSHDAGVDGSSTTSWYVRPVSGGQYGPADTTTFRQWVREGRVTDDALIWRDGWQNWQSAREVVEFKLALHGDAPPPAAEPILLQSETESASPSPAQRYHSRKSRQTKRNVSTIVVLGVVAFLLLIALISVIISQV